MLAAQVCGLLEFMAVPEGFVLFEEGDRVDFCYVLMSGEVRPVGHACKCVECMHGSLARCG